MLKNGKVGEPGGQPTLLPTSPEVLNAKVGKSMQCTGHIGASKAVQAKFYGRRQENIRGQGV